MDTLSSSHVSGINGCHLPRHTVPRCYANTLCTNRNGNLHFERTRLTASGVGKDTRLSMKISIIHVGKAPFCQFLVPRILRNGSPKISSAKSPLRRIFTRTPLPLSPVALSRDQEEHQEREKNSAEREPGTSFTQIAPHHSGLRSKVKNGRSLSKSTPNFDGEYESEVIHSEMVSRLKEVEAATSHEKHWAPEISDPDNEPLRSAGSPDALGNSLAVEDEKWLLRLKSEESSIENCKQQLECAHKQGRKETRREVLKHCLLPLLDRLGFQFPLKVFHDRQSFQKAARVNATVFYHMSYGIERTDYGLGVVEESAVDMADGIGNLRSKSYHPRQAAVFARSMDYGMSSRETTNVKMGRTTRKRMSQMGLGQSASQFGGSSSRRALDVNSHVYVGSERTLRYSSRKPAPAQNTTGGRLWLRADSGVESAGNLFTSLLTIIGLVAFVVSGTYAFAMSQQCLKSGQWFRKASSEPVTVARSAAPETQPKPPILNKANIPEITDENFVDMIKKRSTFVLFYANWCPYCQKLDPTWNALGDILGNKGYDVQLVRMNAEMHPNTAKNFKVVKYPTLILFKGGVAADNYLGPRTVNALMEFIDANLSNQQ